MCTELNQVNIVAIRIFHQKSTLHCSKDNVLGHGCLFIENAQCTQRKLLYETLFRELSSDILKQKLRGLDTSDVQQSFVQEKGHSYSLSAAKMGAEWLENSIFE